MNYPAADVLWHEAIPRYSVQVNQAMTGLTANRQLPPVSSCGDVLGSVLSAQGGKAANRISRPSFFPPSFYGTVLEIPNKSFAGCLNGGSRIFGVSVFLAEGSPDPDLLLPLLRVVSDAALADETVVERSGNLHLKLLGINVPVPEGKWSAQENTNQWGHNDMIVRLLGQSELSVTPFVFPYQGSCSTTMLGTPETAANVVRNPRYVGPIWSPMAHVQVPPPGTFVSATACRDIPSGRMLMAQRGIAATKHEAFLLS